MSVTIDSLELEILDNSEAVIAGLEKLNATLSGFKTLTSTTGFAKMSKQIGELSAAVNKMPGTQKMKEFAEGLSAMAAVPKANISKSLANQITAIGSAAVSLDAAAMSNLRDLKNALQPLTELGKPQLASFITQLKKLPEVATAFKNINMDAFAASIQRVTVAIRPLADEMAKVGAGFSALPSKIQRIIKSNESLSTANLKAGKTFGVMGTGISSLQAKFGIYYAMFSRAANVMGGWVQKSNDYVENLNLFTVSMGQYAGEALKYAEQVQSAMGIDMSEWIRTQGIFMQLGTGFGVAKDKAYQMSKALTQISYDLSSYFNIDIASAQDKVKSGFAGELEPLRNLGYALDQATLQQVAYKNGIQQSVNAMTQAQKSQLRYIAIMEQSRNVMGDMGRTLMTPANAMRILGQQTTQLTRALGNMLIPILMQIVPYVQAVVVVLTEAAQAVANLFGFTIPAIDYSGLDGLASGTGDVTSGLEEATSAAKELNGSLAFDELNIISKNNAPAGGGVGGGGDLGLDMGKFDYDFLGEAQTKVKEIAQSIKDFFGKWKDEIAAIAKLLVGLWAVKKIVDMVNWVKKLYVSFQALSVVKTISGLFSGFLKTFDLFYTSGAGFFKSFDNGLRSIGDSMTGIQKFVGSVVALGLEFIVVKDVVSDLTLGQKNWTDALLILVPTCAAVGVAMYAMLGPVGLSLTAIVGVTAAIMGYVDASTEMLNAEMDADFYGRKGVAITELTDNYVKYTDAIRENIAPLLENKDAFDKNMASIDSNISSIESLAIAANSSSGVVADEAIPKITEAFKALSDSAISNIDPVVFALSDTLKNALAPTLEQMGADVEQYIGYLYVMGDEAKANMKQAQLQVNELMVEYKKTADPEILNQIAEIAAKFSGNSEKAQEFKERLAEIQQGYQQIDFEAPDKGAEAIGRLSGEYQALLADITAAKENTSQYFDELLKWQDDPALIGMGEKIKADMLTGLDLTAEDATTTIGNLLGTIQTSLDAEVEKRKGDVTNSLSGMIKAGWAASWSLDPMKGMEESITRQAKESLSPIQTAIDTQFGAIKTAAEGYGKNTSEGYRDGIVNNSWIATGATGTMAKEVLKSFRAEMGIKSPSTVFWGYGLNVDKGLANGVKENASLALDEIVALGKEMTAQMGSILSSVKSAVSDIIDEVDRAQRAIDSLDLGDIDVNVSGKIRGYSTGGYPESGEFFMAREGGITEYVGSIGNHAAVANNDQIVAGISQGVYEAVMSALSNQQDRPIVVESTVSLDGNEIGRSVDRYNSNKGYSVGGAFANLY